MYCPNCGKEAPAGAQFCGNCGAPISHAAPQPGEALAAAVVPDPTRFAHLPEYWQNVFRKFDQKPSRMQTHWNWPAFFFGPIWYLVKGMPLKALLYVIVAATGIGFPFLIVYAGLYGAWDYYLKEAQGKQLW